ncbi:hypothetical protein ACWFR4_48900, partial [Streptomyces sp. NPDC055140]
NSASASDAAAVGPSRVTVQSLAREAKDVGTRDLSAFLTATGRDVADVYRGSGSWTTILRRAELTPTPTTPVPGEADLLKRMHSFLHVDDSERAHAYRQFTADNAPAYKDLNAFDQTLARMLFFNMWDKAGGFASYAEGLASLRSQQQARAELGQLLTHLMHSPRMLPARPLEGPHAHIPMSVHHAYNRSEILAAMGVARLGGQMPGFLFRVISNASVRFAASHNTPWATAPASPTGQRYQKHAEQGRPHRIHLPRDRTA